MKAKSTHVQPDLAKLKTQALVLVWIGELWNILEAVVALWSGIGAGSVALIGFALDSILELAVGGILIWRLQTKWEDEGEEGAAERKAHKLVGITFFVLAGFILIQSIATLAGFFPEPEQTTVGLILIITSTIMMTSYIFIKWLSFRRSVLVRCERKQKKPWSVIYRISRF